MYIYLCVYTYVLYIIRVHDMYVAMYVALYDKNVAHTNMASICSLSLSLSLTHTHTHTHMQTLLQKAIKLSNSRLIIFIDNN